MKNRYFTFELKSSVHAEMSPSISWSDAVDDMRTLKRHDGGPWFEMLGASVASLALAELVERNVAPTSIDMVLNNFIVAAEPPLTLEEASGFQLGFKNFGGADIRMTSELSTNESRGASHV